FTPAGAAAASLHACVPLFASAWSKWANAGRRGCGGRGMNVARKFTLALLTGILFVHAGAAYYRIQREQTAFEQDVARDAKVIGRMLGHAVESTWLNHGE